MSDWERGIQDIPDKGHAKKLRGWVETRPVFLSALDFRSMITGEDAPWRADPVSLYELIEVTGKLERLTQVQPYIRLMMKYGGFLDVTDAYNAFTHEPKVKFSKRPKTGQIGFFSDGEKSGEDTEKGIWIKIPANRYALYVWVLYAKHIGGSGIHFISDEDVIEVSEQFNLLREMHCGGKNLKETRDLGVCAVGAF